MEEWKEYNFNDITINYDKNRIPLSSKERETRKGEYRYFGAQGVIDYVDDYIFDGQYILLAEDGENLKSKKQSLVQFVSGKFWVNNHAHILTGNEKCDIKFLFYLLDSIDFTPFITGSAQPKLSQQSLSKIYLKLPPLPTQQKIAAILSSLDDKIELNNKINTNLEHQAQALFKNWFVDFEPFGGKMPEGWKVGVISDFGNVICGKTPSTKIKDYYGDEIPFITIPDMHNSVYACYTERYLSVKGAQSQESKNLPPNSICVSCIATPGLVVLTDRISQTNQQINSIVPNENVSLYYIYLTLKNLSETIKMLGSSGSTTSNLNKEQFSKIQITIPNNEVMKKFESFVQPMFEKIRSLQKEDYKLVTIRDTLLPKLMNEEIEV